MQKVIVPNTMNNLVDDKGSASRQMQLFMSALAANVVPLGGIVLWPNALTVPSGWTSVDTLVIGANTYKLITQA